MTQGGPPNMAGLGQQHLPIRPPLQSHHSSSVPSTPFHQPRDLRFHSRSPSPSRALSNQSPRSVASEAPGRTNSQQYAPTPHICKFETTAEFKKRRIPYVDGGNEELGPPKKEPKKSLEPDEHEKLSGDMRELYDRLLPSQESEDRRTQLVQKLDRILNAEWPGNNIRVNVFGSSGNLLSSSDSDVDICITTPLKKLESMHSIATLLSKNGMDKVVCRASAKVPIVKCWDPELRLACDLNVNNPMALENTRMIRTYVQLDERVRPLAKIIKYWTKRRILNDAAVGGTISSYTWICMILNFLQRRDPPILPSLQKMQDHRSKNEQGEQSEFADDLEGLKGFGDANKETLAELLFQFFRHYGYEFKYSKDVVSVKEGRALSREEKGWHPSNYKVKEAQNRLCVEEPFTVVRNLGNSADEYAWSGIHGEIRRAFDLLADGGQLEKCCEQYEFPPEEKPIFQRPPPKPKPTLTRSASQSGRPNHEQGGGRSRKNNRNQSSQRAGNRRASSGATFSGSRGPPFFSPSLANNAVLDYFAATSKGDLHNQLYQQYQYLQAQQDALRSQLAAQQQQNAQAQAQRSGGDPNASPHQNRGAPNGMSSPRIFDNPPQTAPLLPGYLYHYPARYPPPSPLQQARTRDNGTNTNPSSPSLVAAVPALRRQVHRASVTEGSTGGGSIRSQSQPGRSLPHPLTLQQHAHPGFDVSGAMSGAYQSLRASSGQGYPQAIPGMPMPQMPFSPPSMSAPQTHVPHMDNAMPKEYMGYYVGQSPSLVPQFATASQMQMPPMTLRDPPPQRQRRVTPDLMPPPMPNGKHSSRSPSPLGHQRAHSTLGELPSRPLQFRQTPPNCDPPSEQLPPPAQPPADLGGPLIVNGSTPSKKPTPAQPEPTSSGFSHAHPGLEQQMPHYAEQHISHGPSLPHRPNLDTVPSPDRHPESKDRTPTSPAVVSTPRFKQGPKLNLSPNGTPHNGSSGFGDQFTESPSVNAPLLSPVAELRTPSPTHPNAFERDSPQANGLVRAAKIANARQVENEAPASTTVPPKHERTGSAPNPSVPSSRPAAKSPPPAQAPPAPTPPTGASLAAETSAQQKNPWQQATSKKGHKKAKSTAVGQKGNAGGEGGKTSANGALGQPLPVDERERKGG